MNTSRQQSSYLTHLDGLRAIAIMGVLAYHLRAEYCPAGYFGVDLFLAISGFLLLRSLVKAEQTRDFHYGKYLMGKAWRIIPSWFVLTMAVCVVGSQLMNYMHFGGVLKTARYSAIFWADSQIDKSGNYFNEIVQQNPLLHLWYLSITMQLYVLAPLVMLLLARLRSRALKLGILVVLGLLSLSYYVLTTTAGIVSPQTQVDLLRGLGYQMTYYHLVPRMWEVLAGGLVLMLPSFDSRSLLRALLALVGLVGMVLSFFLFETASPYVYMTVLCAMLLIKYGDAGICGRVLCCRPMRALGAISFSVYLWHWPVMVFWKYLRFDKPGVWDEVGMILLSLVLGTLAWWAIERLKMPKGTTRRSGFMRYGMLLALPLVFGFALSGKYYFRDAMTSTGRSEVPPFEEDPAVLRGFSGGSGDGGAFKSPPRTIGNVEAADQIPFFLVIGDSHSFHLYDGLYEQCREQNVRGILFNNSVVPYWYVHRTTKTYGNAEWTPEKAEAVLHYLAEHPEVRYVVIAQNWPLRFVTMEDGDHDWRNGKLIESEEEFFQANAAGLRETCLRLQKLGKKVILLGGTPTFPMPSPMDEWNRCTKLGLPVPERSVSCAEHRKTQSRTDEVLLALEKEGLAIYWDSAEALRQGDRYPACADGTYLYLDSNHLTRAGSVHVARYLLPKLLEQARKDGVQLRRNEPAPPAP